MWAPSKPLLTQIPYFKVSLSLPLLILLGYVLTLIIQLLSFCQGDLNLHETSLEIDFHRNDGVTLLSNLAQHLLDFLLVHQKLAWTKRILVKDIPLLIRADMHTIQDHLSILNMDERFLDTAFAHAHGFHFRTCHGDTGFESLFEKIIVINFLVVGYSLLGFLRHPGILLSGFIHNLYHIEYMIFSKKSTHKWK